MSEHESPRRMADQHLVEMTKTLMDISNRLAAIEAKLAIWNSFDERLRRAENQLAGCKRTAHDEVEKKVNDICNKLARYDGRDQNLKYVLSLASAIVGGVITGAIVKLL